MHECLVKYPVNSNVFLGNYHTPDSENTHIKILMAKFWNPRKFLPAKTSKIERPRILVPAKISRPTVFVKCLKQKVKRPGRGLALDSWNIFLVNDWSWPWPGDPFKRKFKILIFYDLGFKRQNHSKSAPNDAKGPNMGGYDKIDTRPPKKI